MYVSKIAPEARTWALVEAFIAPQQRMISAPPCIVPATSRGEHAKMLQIAAARRQRAAERAGLQREEDAGYWKAVAPAAIRKARVLRRHVTFASLPG